MKELKEILHFVQQQRSPNENIIITPRFSAMLHARLFRNILIKIKPNSGVYMHQTTQRNHNRLVEIIRSQSSIWFFKISFDYCL
jgi:hypothetical protein